MTGAFCESEQRPSRVIAIDVEKGELETPSKHPNTVMVVSELAVKLHGAADSVEQFLVIISNVVCATLLRKLST